MALITQEWDCYVLGIGSRNFTARMVKRGDREEMEGEIPRSKVTKRDQGVFTEGAFFTLRVHKGRTTVKFSHCRYTADEIAKAETEAAKILSHFVSKGPVTHAG